MANPNLLNTMLIARRQMAQCIERFDVLLYNTNDRALTERGLDQFIVETITALRRVYVLRNGVDGGIP